MKKYWFVPFLLVWAMGCGKQHPVKVFVAPAMSSGSVEKIAVFPFATSLHHSDDPDEIAPRTLDVLFRQELNTRHDYKFVAPSSVNYALQGEGLEAEAKEFIDGWRNFQKADTKFLSDLAGALQVDAVLIGVVDLWQKDEVDPRENATPTTYVGATVSVLNVKDGSVLFQASDEDFLEGAHNETTDRTIIRSGTGSIRSDTGARSYQAPEYKEVALKVVRALVSSLPPR